MLLNSFNSLFELFAALNFTYFTIGRKDTRLITLNDNILEYYQEVELTLDEIQKDLDFNLESLNSKKQYYKKENFEIPESFMKIIQLARKSEQPLSIDSLILDLNTLQDKLNDMRSSVKKYFDRTILPQTFSHASIYASLYSVLILFVGTFHTTPDKNHIEEGLSIFNIFSIIFILSCILFFEYEKLEKRNGSGILHRLNSFFKVINFPKTIFWFSVSALISLVLYTLYLPPTFKIIHIICLKYALDLNKFVVITSLIIPVSHFTYYILVKILWLILSIFQSKTELSKLQDDIIDFKVDAQSNLDMFEELFKHLAENKEDFKMQLKTKL